MNSGPGPAAEKGGCLVLALFVLGFGLWFLWPAQPIPVGADGTPLERVLARVTERQDLAADARTVALQLEFRWRERDYNERFEGSTQEGAGRPIEVGHRLELWLDPAQPQLRWVPALGQEPQDLVSKKRSLLGRIVGGLSVALGLFGLFASLTGGGGSKAPGARPGEDDRH